jgi:hypothetical protein
MLEAIGVSSVDALFEQVPAGVRLQRDLDIPPAMSEPDLMAHLQALAGQDADPAKYEPAYGGWSAGQACDSDERAPAGKRATARLPAKVERRSEKPKRTRRACRYSFVSLCQNMSAFCV